MVNRPLAIVMPAISDTPPLRAARIAGRRCGVETESGASRPQPTPRIAWNKVPRPQATKDRLISAAVSAGPARSSRASRRVGKIQISTTVDCCSAVAITTWAGGFSSTQ